MSITETLERISKEYAAAKEEPFKGHPLADFIRGPAADEVEAALGSANRDLHITGSPGKGNWSGVPWVGVFDPLITTSALAGIIPSIFFTLRRRSFTCLSIKALRKFGRSSVQRRNTYWRTEPS
jgi:5-methylcytosine-specific restriction protein A